MNIKRFFGAFLTILGIGGLIYAAVAFTMHGTGTQNTRIMITFGILGLIFFGSGVSLIKNTNDKAKP